MFTTPHHLLRPPFGYHWTGSPMTRGISRISFNGFSDNIRLLVFQTGNAVLEQMVPGRHTRRFEIIHQQPVQRLERHPRRTRDMQGQHHHPSPRDSDFFWMHGVHVRTPRDNPVCVSETARSRTGKE
mmetsp:Transcript_28830/g.33157  ORF Transcript_28830/g.33157 Transcript_28830/m.33157 type:complete len:127 (-) Transcript_28830:7-387(-)